MSAPRSVFHLLALCALAGVLVAGLLFPVAGAAGGAVNAVSDAVSTTPAELFRTNPPSISTIEDRNGSPIAYLYDQDREPVQPDQIAHTMKQAIVAIEDRRFYEHRGVDWQGTARALVANQLDGEVAQGGSTLTQQYVKNYLINVLDRDNPAEQERDRATTAARKLREARVAMQLEHEMSKDEILAGYLNVVSFGNQTYGVAAAARAYFGTTPDKLTIPQAALLAGIPNNPSELNPYLRPQSALQRRNLVIDAMLANHDFGSDPVAAQRIATDAKNQPLGVVQPSQRLPQGCFNAKPNDGFFCSYVLSYLAAAGISRDQLSAGGYTIKTTLDPVQTAAAKKAAQAQVPKTAPGIANAIAMVRPGKTTHEVTALAANRDYGVDASLGQTTQQPPSEVTHAGAGSIYKIFTSAAALERGMGIFDTVDVPPEYTSPVFLNNGAPYSVKNAGPYPPQMNLQQALATSPNTAFIKIEEQIGVPAAVDMASRLGLRAGMSGVNAAGTPLKADGSNGPSYGQLTKRQNNGAFTLGPGPTSVLELANVDATLFSGGTWCPPTPIQEVRNRDGQVVPVPQAPCEQVVDPKLANTLIVGMSKDDQPGGTSAQAAQEAHWTRPVAGKTGTTNDSYSVGFVGGVPQLAGAVLTFNDGVRQEVICQGHPPHLCGVHGTPGVAGVSGGSVAAPTFYQAMTTALAGQPVLPLPQADPRYTDGGIAGPLVPEVTGHPAADAESVMARTGYRATETSVPSAAPAGMVVGQTPHGPQPPGSTITLYVSTGYLPHPVAGQ